MFEGLELSTTLPDGTYYNREPGTIYETLFVDLNDNSLKKITELQNTKLENGIYFHPNKFPGFDRLITKGTVWKNCYVLSCSYEFIVKDKKAIVSLHNEPLISLENYAEQYFSLIEQEIEKIYANHDNVILQFSGGIDSLVLLSYIMRLGYLSRTTIVNFENYFVEDHPDLLRNNNKKNIARNKIINNLKNQCRDSVIMELTNEDWLWAANNFSFTKCRLYGSMKIFKNYPNSGLITGHHGDQTLLHDAMWLSNLFAISPDINVTKNKYLKLLEDKSLYMNNYIEFDHMKEFHSLPNFTWHMKYWSDLNGYNNCKFYTPLGVDTRLCRYIDTNSFSMRDVLDAKVARYFIKKNVGNALDEYIIHQGNLDGDVFAKRFFNKKDFDPNIFSIPKNLKHTVELAWLKKMLNEEIIETNTIYSLKVLQYISNVFKETNE